MVLLGLHPNLDSGVGTNQQGSPALNHDLRVMLPSSARSPRDVQYWGCWGEIRVLVRGMREGQPPKHNGLTQGVISDPAVMVFAHVLHVGLL